MSIYEINDDIQFDVLCMPWLEPVSPRDTFAEAVDVQAQTLLLLLLLNVIHAQHQIDGSCCVSCTQSPGVTNLPPVA